MSEEDESKVAAATTEATEAEAEGEGGEHEESGVHKEEESTATFEPIVSGDGRRLSSKTKDNHSSFLQSKQRGRRFFRCCRHFSEF